MAGRPGIYRGVRFGDGLALLAAGARAGRRLAGRRGAHRVAPRLPTRRWAATTSPFSAPTASGLLRRGGGDIPLPGDDPALGDGRAAVIAGGEIVILSAVDLRRARAGPAPPAPTRSRSRAAGSPGARAARAATSSAPATSPTRPGPGPEQSLGKAGGRAQLGRPSLDANRLVYARATTRENVIVGGRLGAKHKKRAKST